ncbi:MAG: hypothetical protein RL189_439 [Pseudomonadota bacterium]|jgi:hypothetical protein
MKTRARHFLIPVMVATSAIGCKQRDFNSTEQQATAQTQKMISFCQPPAGQKILWDAPRVQQEISNLLKESGYKSSGLSVYAEVYLAMTKQRDAARCDPTQKMYPQTELNRRLNDALADLMTKGLVTSQRVCLKSFANPALVVPTIGQQLCELGHEALNKRWSALEFAMGSTAQYLTSIMGIALSALPHADILWRDTPYTSLQGRIGYMKKEFRPVYDAFNLFLSDNLHTVADVLMKENRVDCGLFKHVAAAAETTRAPTLIFKNIRDKTFELGLDLATAWSRGLHPFTAGEAAWNQERPFGSLIKEPPALDQLRRHARDSVGLLKNPLMKLFKNKDAATYISGQGLTCPVPVQPK